MQAISHKSSLQSRRTLLATTVLLWLSTRLFLAEYYPFYGTSDCQAIRLAEQAISNLSSRQSYKTRRSYSSFVVRDSRPGKIVVYVAPRPERDGGTCTVTMTPQGKILEIDTNDL